MHATSTHTHTHLHLTSYRFKPTLDEDVCGADLIISHAGAGSILEALRKQKRLLVVVNTSLMDNHQQELACAMEREGYVLSAGGPERVAEKLSEIATFPFKPYPPPDLSHFHMCVCELTGVHPTAKAQ
eukprot:GDKI01047578.1.p1 GENE.GDKI01047578.1~~GDKI01047578.1.p1  ORF type:complete len:128 (-),score=34.79 GDKI01047578.1:358-741(-)